MKKFIRSALHHFGKRSRNVKLDEIARHATQVAVWSWNLETDTLYLDSQWAEMLGLKWGELVMSHETWKSRMHPEDLEVSSQQIQAYINNETEFLENTHRLKHVDGSWRHILTRGKITKYSPNGRPLLMAGVCIDLSKNMNDQKKIQQELAWKQNHAKLIALGHMASSIAHEINNPLSVIRMNAELLSSYNESQLSREKVVEKCGKIIATADRVSGIIRALRSISASSKTPRFSWVPFQQFIDDVLELCLPRIRSENVELLIDTKNTSINMVYIDHAQLTQALINLLNNSCDALKELDTRWIKIDVSNDTYYLYIYVTDSGAGVPLEIAEKMTDQYFTTKDGTGLGLGLNLVQSYLSSHNGQLTYKLTAGHTSFCMKLPLSTICPSSHPQPTP
jgi:PAS domain S-box-containing protein